MLRMMVVQPGTSKRSSCRQDCRLLGPRCSHPPSFRLPTAFFPSSFLTLPLTVLLPRLSTRRTMAEKPGGVLCPYLLPFLSSVLQICNMGGQPMEQCSTVVTMGVLTGNNSPPMRVSKALSNSTLSRVPSAGQSVRLHPPPQLCSRL